MTAIRIDVYDAINTEREYQDALNTTPLAAGGELALLRKYLRDAENTFAETFGDPHERPTMHVLRKIVAIAVRAMEHHGAPPRDVQGSLQKRKNVSYG